MALDQPTNLPAGTRLGPYQITALLGAGGMGVVYRARDTRLGRDVAVKVLPTSLADDKERLRRFEIEAQAAGRLNHPNLLAIHDVGVHEGASYLVTELLEGQTLRDRLDGAALPVRKAVEYGLQAACGLAAAHDKGIVHRDLKPENLFVTNDGRLKILDFGLAKLLPSPVGASIPRDAPTVTLDTDPGTVMGTVAYMSPEQVRGQTVDYRSDIFSLDVMLSGVRAFRRDSAVETMNAILKEEPPELTGLDRTIPPALERIVRHCLEKSTEVRFQSARDLAFDLESLSASSVTPISPQGAPKSRVRKRWLVALLMARVGVVAGAAFLTGMREGRVDPLYFQALTFRRGWIVSARFGSEEPKIYYGAAWEGGPIRLYETRQGGTDPPPLFDANILGIAPKGRMILSLGCRQEVALLTTGSLARLDSSSGAEEPNVLLQDPVYDADLGPDGETVVMVRKVAGVFRLELLGSKSPLHENKQGWISDPRFSREGDKIAFIDHVAPSDDAGSIKVVNRDGSHKMTLTG